MKKLLALSAVALAFTVTPALAEEHGDKGDKGKMFEKHDTNSDGVISKDEFLYHAEKRFVEMDADGNGEVSKDEAKAAHDAMREKMKERKAEHKDKKAEE